MHFKIYLTLFVFFIGVSLFAQTHAILIDFGSQSSPLPWNNLSNTNSGASIGSLYNNYGLQTQIGLSVTDGFSGINSSGTQNPHPGLGVPASASGDSFYGHMQSFGGGIDSTAALEINGLDTAKSYTLKLFASRIASDNRETKYVIHGQTTDSALLQVANNTDSMAVFHMKPSAAGIINIKATAGPNNNNSYGFFYLGAIRLEYAADSAITPSLELVSPQGNEYWQVGKTVDIVLNNFSPHEVIIDYTIDDGSSWINIDTMMVSGRYTWTIPNTPSTDCKVRIRADTLIDVSDNTFEISTDSSSCGIVVIGSSTAAGAGASVSDSAWVNRLRNHIYQNDTRYWVTNLAQGGYTSFHLLPTGTAVSGSIQPDTNRNISKALSLDPTSIIVNLPSNDAAYGFDVPTQLSNFELISAQADSQNVHLWVCTTQPRNFSSSTAQQIQKDMRDSIFALYGSYAIDFWNGIAGSNGHILPAFNSGDGVHLNDKGHRLLFQRVWAKQLDTTCGNNSTGISEMLKIQDERIMIYPNPFSNRLYINIQQKYKGNVTLELFDIYGRKVYKSQEQKISAAKSDIYFDIDLQGVSCQQLLVARLMIVSSEKTIQKSYKVIYNNCH